MKLYNDLKLRFDQPVWALHPELALFDAILEKNPHIADIVEKDVKRGSKQSGFGRQDSPTVEQVLRAAIFKEVKQLDYRELEIAMYDSTSFAIFMKLDGRKRFSYSVMQKYISRISEESLRKIFVKINELAVQEGIEDIVKVSTDTTVVETNVHYPTNNSLVWDCIKTATRILKKIKKDNKDEQNRLDAIEKESKKLNYQINNTKKQEEQKTLFDPYLSYLQELISGLENITDDQHITIKLRAEINDFLPKMKIVYRNSVQLQIDGKKIENKDKLFSIFESHTDIQVKGQRDVEFGHKVLISRGNSNLILDYSIENGNPSDKNLLIPSMERIIDNYTIIPTSTSNDGGFTSQSNIDWCKNKGITNIVFTKITQSLKNVVSSPELERMLKKWRGTTEAVISNLKRGFGLNRVTWEGWDRFRAKVAWSMIGYNLRVLSNRLVALM